MTRFVQRWIANAVLSISMVAATVGASYGQQKPVGIGNPQHDESVIVALQQAGHPFPALGFIPQQISTSDVARRPGS
jgi:hypothetical protein